MKPFNMTMYFLLCSLATGMSNIAYASPNSDLKSVLTQKSHTVSKKSKAYIFVSTSLFEEQLINLAKAAKAHNAILVLNGFNQDLPTTRNQIDEVNRICCDNKGPEWVIYPQLFRRYQIDAVPAFVLAKNDNENSASFSKVTGDMPFTSALKIFNSKSRDREIRELAKQVYIQGNNERNE